MFVIALTAIGTLARRQLISEKVSSVRGEYSVLWVEAVCDDEEVVNFNMLTKVRYSPDFKHMTAEQAGLRL